MSGTSIILPPHAYTPPQNPAGSSTRNNYIGYGYSSPGFVQTNYMGVYSNPDVLDVLAFGPETYGAVDDFEVNGAEMDGAISAITIQLTGLNATIMADVLLWWTTIGAQFCVGPDVQDFPVAADIELFETTPEPVC